MTEIYFFPTCSDFFFKLFLLLTSQICLPFPEIKCQFPPESSSSLMYRPLVAPSVARRRRCFLHSHTSLAESHPQEDRVSRPAQRVLLLSRWRAGTIEGRFGLFVTTQRHNAAKRWCGWLRKSRETLMLHSTSPSSSYVVLSRRIQIANWNGSLQSA